MLKTDATQLDQHRLIRNDPLVLMYEDDTIICKDHSSIYLTTTVTDAGHPQLQPWHRHFHQVLRASHWTGYILMPESRINSSNCTLGHQYTWREIASKQAQHLVFHWSKNMSRQEIPQLAFSLGRALSSNEYKTGQKIWVVAPDGRIPEPTIRHTVALMGGTVLSNLGKVAKYLKESS